MFLTWNDTLAAHFFNREAAGQTVWLYVSEELIENIGASKAVGGVAEFVKAAKDGPAWPTPAGLCQKALKTYEGWRDRGLEYPPYVTYLGLFVLAAGLEGDFAAHAYYPRLRALLGDSPTTGELPSFHRMYELWDDLERWSARDRSGEIGIFQSRIARGMFHIGLPLAQSLLADQDRRALPVIFSRAGLDPSTPPPDMEISHALRIHGGDLLRPRTVRLLSGKGDSEALNVLIELVAEELSEWNGEAPAEGETPASNDVNRQVHAALRLCIQLDRPAGRLRALLRCTLNRREFPEGGLAFLAGESNFASCDEEVPGWSTCLIEPTSGRLIDAAQIDWLRGFTATEATLAWKFHLRPRNVRVLVSGTGVGLPGLVEVYQLPLDQPFYVLFHEDEWPHIEHWAGNCCEAFEIIRVNVGMPPCWQIGSSSRATADDADIASRYPVLTRPGRTALRLVGGISSGPGTSFFAFAPPRIVVDGSTDGIHVRCNGQILPVPSDNNSYQLPENLPVETRILLEIVADSDVLKRRSLYLTGNFSWNRAEPVEVFDEWGDESSTLQHSGVASGALVCDAADDRPFKRPVLLAPGLSRYLNGRVFFVGRVPGEIVTWPREHPPTEWHPVWAVPMDRRGVAIYCGGGIEDSAPLEARGLDPDRVKQWKQVLWHRRKRIAPPFQARLATLWRLYAEAAQHA